MIASFILYIADLTVLGFACDPPILRGEERFREEGETAKSKIGRRERGRKKKREKGETSKEIWEEGETSKKIREEGENE